MIFQRQSIKTCVITMSVLSTLILGGCQATQKVVNKFDNGSLNYQASQQLAPIVLPAEQPVASFTPLYPMPYVRDNTLQLTNESGTRYQLPPPFRSQTVSSKPVEESLF